MPRGADDLRMAAALESTTRLSMFTRDSHFPLQASPLVNSVRQSPQRALPQDLHNPTAGTVR